MALVGNLQDINLASLVGTIIQDNATARIELWRDSRLAAVFIKDGRPYHAEVAEINGSDKAKLFGETVIYELLTWPGGEFKVDRDITSPQKSISASWDFLLMEGLRSMDESQLRNGSAPEAELEEFFEGEHADFFQQLSPADQAEIDRLTNLSTGDNEMASKSEQLNAILQETVRNSSDLTGVVVVDNDGLMLASVLNGNVDGDRVAAVSAGLLSLAGRSAQQLGQGAISQTLIKAEGGNIIALRVGDKASFVALANRDANLGMAFLECRDAADNLARAI
ncbi:MAG: DUF4388 domain-containing protein [Anaerolineales bacterium]|nr:DUF4388 domain-containing protein [Anaerolineales bacterium]MCB0016811.1 DUF4388 domain-containing protein [Anaerolineales bacterium]MCB0029071.1 DUF4388 domain-containing protein [Anaerolineales bacterium]